MEDDKDYIKNIVHERTTKSFTIDMNTLGMVKDFQEKYHRNTISQTIEDLVNIGLANLGYKDKKDIDARFKGIDIDISPIDLPEPESLDKNYDIDIIATGISHSQHERMRSIIDITKRLCDMSPDLCASRSDIISEAEIGGMEYNDVEGAIDRLKRNGQIYEPMKGKYRVTEY